MSNAFTKFLAATLAAFILTASTLFPAAHADEARMIRSITISGRGEVKAVPDIASITLGVASFDATAQVALAANTRTMNDLLALLEQSGIAKTDVATSNFMVNPRYDYGQANNGGVTPPPKVVGYDVSNTVMLTARDISKLGDLLDKAVSAGSNQIHGISFSVSKPEALLDKARQAAVADARRKAELYAAAGGFALGDIISMSEGGGFQPPMPMVMKSAMAESAGAVPVAQGEQTLAIDVNVVWQIK
jgi:uncharacterized protein